ncbi:Imm8 family immunity protein [Blastomonas sp. SL216]|uniref:Imm8 family immunity protein n=1 Tax=Blastomonas sp. SL216 TaxID=2995169 RepID=UPI0023775560|nr:Imm8 family immunity protein [Blastomonas sp. SL216]
MAAYIGRSGNDPVAEFGLPGHPLLMKRPNLQPELRSLRGQVDEDLSDLTPVSGSFCHTLRAEIGVTGEKGADAFEFDVCSPAWLENELDSLPILSGGSRLIAKRFAPAVVEAYVRKRLLHATGPDWQTIATKLGQWSRWEFDSHEA